MCSDRHDQNTNELTEKARDNSDIEKVQKELSEIVDETDIAEKIVDEFLKSDRLTPREKKVIQYRFGLDGEEPHSIEQICEEFRITRGRIREIEARCRGRRCSRIASKILRDFIDEPTTETGSEENKEE